MYEITEKNKMNNSENKETTMVETSSVQSMAEAAATAIENLPSTKEEATPNVEKAEVTEKKVDEKTETSSAIKEKEETTKEKADDKKEEENKIELKNLDLAFTLDLMAVPTASYEEYRMVSYLILWARRKGVKYEFDSYGNVYLTKGTLAEGEFYPCVTSHLDTVQTKQKAYAQAGMPLELKIREKKTFGANPTVKHELFVDGMGIGADCKTGVLISLSLFDHFDKIKGAFFLQEEVGMLGSKQLNADWFKDVGYVVGWDSPDLNRAAYESSGTMLMNKDFFVNNIKDICEKHGLTSFRSEPFTDVVNIREKTNLVCMNFGNGGYAAHSAYEYMILEDTDHALTMGIDIIKGLGTKQFIYECKKKTYGGFQNGYYSSSNDEDEKYFRTLGTKSYGSYNGSGYHSGYDDDYWANYNERYSSTKPNSTSGTTQTTPTKTAQTNKVDEEVVQYIVNRYETHIEEMKTSLEEKCKTLGVDFSEFSEIFETKIKF